MTDPPEQRHGTSFLELVKNAVDEKHDVPFATWYDSKGNASEELTFGEVWENAHILACYLRNKWNVEKGECVILCYSPGLGFLTGFLGCLRAGVTASIVYPPVPGALGKSLPKIANVVADCKPSLVLCDGQVNLLRIADKLNIWSKTRNLWPKHDNGEDITFQVTDNLNAKGVARSFDEPVPAAGDLAFLQYTSGSTGDPKGVMVTFGALAANVVLLRAGFHKHFEDDGGIPDEVVGFSWLPQYHDLGLVYCVLVPLAAGWRNHMMSPIAFIKNPLLWMELMSRHEVNWSIAPDFAFRLVARKFVSATKSSGSRPIPGLDLSSIRYLMSAAEPLRLDTKEIFDAAFGDYKLPARWFTVGYGLAENVVGVCFIHGYHLSSPRSEDIAPYIAVGCRENFHPSLVVKIVDPRTLREVPDGETGELWIAGPSTTAGYYGKPKLTKESFDAKAIGSDDSFLRTGDLGFFQNAKLFVCGRIKDLIIVNGANYYPQDVEAAVVDAAPADVLPGGIAAFASDGQNNGGFEIVFEVRDRAQESVGVTLQAVKRNVVQKIGLVPSRIVAIAAKSIPKTTSGKIQRRRSREMLHSGKLPVLLEWKKPVADISCEIKLEERRSIPKTHDDIDDIFGSFFAPDFDRKLGWDELGLSSIVSVELREVICEKCSIDLPYDYSARYPTPAALRSYILAERCNVETNASRTEELSALEIPKSTTDRDPISRPIDIAALDAMPSIMTWLEYMILWLINLLLRWTWKLHSRNVHHVPAGESFILAVNHLTHCDSLLVAGLLPGRSCACRLRVVSKVEHLDTTEGRSIVNFLRGISLDRANAASRIEVLETCALSLRCGRNVLIHPEGTRSRDGTLADFNEGVAHLSRRSGCKVVPCYISNAAHVAWPADRRLPRVFSKEPVVVSFGKAMSLSSKGETDREFTNRIRASVLDLARGLDENPEEINVVSASLSGALRCRGIRKSHHFCKRDFSISVKPRSIQQVQKAVAKAKREGRRVIPMGAGWSRGGQAIVSLKVPSLTIDMTGLNKIVDIDTSTQSAVVQAGAKWAHVRRALAIHGLAPLATQSYDVFSVGGSISANAHGRTLDTPTVVGGVLSITLIDHNGNVVTTIPGEELFHAVCGGFGLVGIIVEAKIQLTKDALYRSELRVLSTEGFAKCFDRDAMLARGVHFQFARLSCVPGALFETTMWETSSVVESLAAVSYSSPIKESPGSGRGPLHYLQWIMVRALRSGKVTHLLQHIRWIAENVVRQRDVGRLCRRNVTQQEDFGVLLPWQGHLLEVFIPCSRFLEFLERSRSILNQPTAPTVINATVRWVGEDQNTVLSYSTRGSCFSVVIYLNEGESVASTARKIYDAAVDAGGSFYLVYEPWYTDKQLKRAYPDLPRWMMLKKRFDPVGMFQSSLLDVLDQEGTSFQQKEASRSMLVEPRVSSNAAANYADDAGIHITGPLSQDVVLEWLGNLSNHLAWHGVVIARFQNRILISSLWLPLELVLLSIFGDTWLVSTFVVLYLLLQTYRVKIHVSSQSVHISSFFLEHVFTVHPTEKDDEKGSPYRVSAACKGIGTRLFRQLQDAELVLWRLKQLSACACSFQHEEAAVQAGRKGGAGLVQTEILTKDGVAIKLARVMGKNNCCTANRSAVFFGGYGSSTFRTGSLQLVPHFLEQGYSDVWLVETRISSHLSGISCHRHLDDVALYDIPCAISHIREAIRPNTPLHVVAHCMGALSVSMSLASGATPETDVTSLTLLNVALTPKLENQTALEREITPSMFGLASGTEPKTKLATQRCDPLDESVSHRLMSFICERIHTKMDGVMANNGLLHGRYGGISTAARGGIYRDETLTSHTRNAMAGYYVGGVVHYDFIQHMRQILRGNIARAKRYSPTPVSHARALPEDYLEAACLLRIPIFGFVGSENTLFGQSILQTFDHLKEERPRDCIQDASVVPGFGHHDLFMSPMAKTAWFPRMIESQIRAENSKSSSIER